MKKQYHSLFSELLTNALLHLWSTIAASDRYIPLSKRNEILVKFLKPKLKDAIYKPIKGEIKLLIQVGRGRNGNLEMKLDELYQMAVTFDAKMSNDTQRLFDLLSLLHQQHGFDSKLFHEGEEVQSETIYILQDHIDNGFDELGNQIAPISMLVESKRSPFLVEWIQANGEFGAEMKEWNAETGQAHILLHPYPNAA